MNKMAFVFAGQGAQYTGMGKDFFDNFESSRNIFKLADDALGTRLSDICFNGTQEELAITKITQPAILTVTTAILEALKSKVCSPDMVAGLSLGEYSAHVCSGSIDFQDAVKLVQKRGQFMQDAVPLGVGTMAAIMGFTKEQTIDVCIEAEAFGIVEPSNFNCPGQTVIGGEIEAVDKACELAKANGAKRAMRLKVSAPFHTSMLEPAAFQLSGELKSIKVNPMIIPIVTNVDASVIIDETHIKDILVKQVKSPVHWEDSIVFMIENGVDTFVEIGPGKALSGFIKKINKNVNIMNIENMISFEETVSRLEELGYGKDGNCHWSTEGIG